MSTDSIWTENKIQLLLVLIHTLRENLPHESQHDESNGTCSKEQKMVHVGASA